MNDCFMKGLYKNDKERKGNKTRAKFCEAYWEMMSAMNKERREVHFFTPSGLRKLCKKIFDPDGQHCCQKFHRYMLSDIQEEVNSKYQRKYSRYKELKFRDSKEAFKNTRKETITQ